MRGRGNISACSSKSPKELIPLLTTFQHASPRKMTRFISTNHAYIRKGCRISPRRNPSNASHSNPTDRCWISCTPGSPACCEHSPILQKQILYHPSVTYSTNEEEVYTLTISHLTHFGQRDSFVETANTPFFIHSFSCNWLVFLLFPCECRCIYFQIL